MTFLLDTDTVTLLFQSSARILARINQAARPVVTRVVTRVEVLRGRIAALQTADGSAAMLLAQQRFLDTETDLQRLPCVSLTATAVTQFERLNQIKGLRRIGRMDLLIAGIALANQATLVTRNQRDFQRIPGLVLENWAD